MLSISRAKSAKSGMSYFEADSYYAKKNEQGIWFGKNTEFLGLSEGIERENFRRILEGCDLKGNKLVRNAMDGKRRSYIDFTFSCPKSVSVLYYTDDRIEEAHNTAITKALKEIENNYSVIREGAGGHKSYVTSNIIAARFNHHESRELEPQLHSHCVIMNMTKGNDGKWRSIEMGQMYRNQLYIGQTYRNELAKELKKLGYKIEITDRVKGLFEIAGISKQIIDEFSTRRKQVLEAKKLYNNFNVTEARKAELACLKSRKYKHDSDIEEIRTITQEKLKEYGTSLEKIKQEALLAGEEDKNLPILDRYECLRMAIEDITENQSAFKKEDVITLSLKNGLGQYSNYEMTEEFNHCRELIELGKKDILIGKTVAPDVKYFTTNEMFQIEGGIVYLADKLNDKVSGFVSKEKVDKTITKRESSGFGFSDGQKKAIEMMCTSKSFLNIVQGDAGSGKTFAVETFREIMNESGFTVRGFAPTAKAAVELQSAKIKTATVDSFLISNKEEIGNDEIWVVDESGMMGSRKLNRFLKEAEKFKAKVILIGDSKQFQAIEQGKMFTNLQKHPSTGYAEITEVRRQKTQHLKEVVSEFKKRNVSGVQEAFRKMEESGCILHVKDRNERLSTVARDYVNDREKKIDSLVLTATNQDRSELNSIIRNTLIQKGIVRDGFLFDTHQVLNINGNKRRFADSYKTGQHIFFQKDFDGIIRGTQAEIISVDPQLNSISIKIESQGTKDEIVKTLNLFKGATCFQAFNVVQKRFGVGDSVITLKNDKLLRVENGKIGTIKSINSNGYADIVFSSKELTVKELVFKADLKKQCITAITESEIGNIPKGTECHVCDKNNGKKTITLEYTDIDNKLQRCTLASTEFKKIKFVQEERTSFNLKNYSYIDHAYAVTSYKSQGATVEQVRWCHDHTQPTNYNEAYVAITRAKYDAVVYTSDPVSLVEHACREQEKESILDWQEIREKISGRKDVDFYENLNAGLGIESGKITKKDATFGLEI